MLDYIDVCRSYYQSRRYNIIDQIELHKHNFLPVHSPSPNQAFSRNLDLRMRNAAYSQTSTHPTEALSEPRPAPPNVLLSSTFPIKIALFQPHQPTQMRTTCFRESPTLGDSSPVDNSAVLHGSSVPLHFSSNGYEAEAVDMPALAVPCFPSPGAPTNLAPLTCTVVYSTMAHKCRSSACNPLAVAATDERTANVVLVRLSGTVMRYYNWELLVNMPRQVGG